jgi:hypothetical protein
MRTLLAAILILAIAIALMCVGIIVKGRFPETEISKNEKMRELGIKCMNEQEKERTKSCSRGYTDACTGCEFYKN